MNKGDFIKAVATAAGTTNKDADAIVNAVLDTIVAEVKNGEKIVFPGFGSFEAKSRAARVGVNPKTGEKIQIAASKFPTFTAGANFKAEVK